ncbi:hypothetical protein PHYBOEH_008606 [Phytophthora boehmeriae]|uniref:Uncharacterized protein n=1 Tax=Phytophthora boehmeriae TaxID=109152 RepID=A0A8T1W3Q8_9STRA|nr:hypothetical protein PHYBOEH_008606 [Phytophthora boehmeriae]
MVNGTSVKIQYQNSIGTMHYVKVATSPGRFQDLVMWDDLTDAARSSLNHHKFNKAEVPINDANFPTNLKNAYDAWKNDSIVEALRKTIDDKLYLRFFLMCAAK